MQTEDKFGAGIIAIVRSADALQSLKVKVNTDREAKPGDEDILADLPSPASVDCSPFEQSVSPRGKSLLAAWDLLSSVVDWNTEILEAMLIVLIDAIPLDTIPAPNPYPFDAADQPREIRPTAAHPRAYQGTTYKPPKTKSPRPINLQPFLCDGKAVTAILGVLAPNWGAAVSSLSRRRYGSSGEASMDCDPYAAWNHDCRQEILTPALDALFRYTLLPAAGKCSWSEIEKVHAAFHRLRLQDSPDLLSCIVAILAMSTAAAISGWCVIISDLPADQWTGFAGLLLRTEACKVDPATLPDDFMDMLIEAGSGRAPAYRTYCLLRGVARRIDCQYLLDGFRLNDRLYVNRYGGFHDSLDKVEASGHFPVETAEKFIRHLESSLAFEESHVTSAWQACAKLDGFSQFFAGYDWLQWRPVICQELLRVAVDLIYEDEPGEMRLKWSYLRNNMDIVESSLLQTPDEYRYKFCDGLRKCLDVFFAKEMTDRSIPNACALLSRLCRMPFHNDRNTAFVWTDFIAYLSPAQLRKMLDAPNAAFAQLEKACRTDNNIYSIGYGTWMIAQKAPAFILASFLLAPSRLFRTSRTVGCLLRAERVRLVADFIRLPMMEIDTELLNDADAYAFIVSREHHFEKSPIPQVLRGHYAGTAPLNAPRVAHYHIEMRQNWQRALLKLLEDMAFDRLALGFDPMEMGDNVRHALRIRPKTEKNRRPLKKFLTAYWAGRKNYVREHQLTQDWLKRHPRLNVDLWTKGIPYSNTLPTGETFTISLETDPLEALKLGTYVGSCLGIGGSFVYSAAATVLDINKQVLYARDSRGTVIGRQVVAYSEEGEMVCFSVYPQEAERLKPLFAEYDRLFATALNITIFTSHPRQDEEERDYKIEMILSHGWWDDCHWEVGAIDADTPSPRHSKAV